MLFLLASTQLQLLSRKRRVLGDWYIKDRYLLWWRLYREAILSNDAQRFSKFFRMSPQSFDYVCGLVRDDLARL